MVRHDNKLKQSTINLEKKDVIDYAKLLKNEFHNEKEFAKKNKYYISSDNNIVVLVIHSRKYDHPSYKYWYTFHTYQKDILDKYLEAYILFYFDDTKKYKLINTHDLYPYLEKMGKTVKGNNIGWHLHIQEKNGIYSFKIPNNGYLTIDKLEKQKSKKSNNNINTIKIALNDYKVINIK